MSLGSMYNPTEPRMPSSSKSLAAIPQHVGVRGQAASVGSASSSRMKSDEEVEAERLWWSETSERQVKEIQKTFGSEFQKTTDRLRADLQACQSKLERMVDSESDQRASAMAEFRREADSQQVSIAELTRSQNEMKAAIGKLEIGIQAFGGDAHNNKAESLVLISQEVQKTHALSQETRKELVSFSKQLTENSVQVAQIKMQISALEASSADLRREQAPNKAQFLAMEAAFADLRQELMGNQEQALSQTSEAERALDTLKRDVAEMKEKVVLQAHAHEEAQYLHKVISQSAGDLGRGIEELSNAMVATENTLRQDLELHKRASEAAERQHRADISEELERLRQSITQGLEDERESRNLETTVLKSRVEVAGNIARDLEVSMLELVSDRDFQSLRDAVEENNKELVQLQSSHASLQRECQTLNSSGSVRETHGFDDARVLSRLEALETKLQDANLIHAEALETTGRKDDNQLLACQTLERLESEIKDLGSRLPSFHSRLQAAESELRKQSWEVAPLTARADASESELLRLHRAITTDKAELHADIEALKRQIRMLDCAPDCPVQQPELLQSPRQFTKQLESSQSPSISSQQLEGTGSSVASGLPPDLRENISNLVRKVNTTISSSLPGDEASARANSGIMTTEVSVDENGYAEALKAIQELKQRNLALREQNASLAQELQDVTPVQSNSLPVHATRLAASQGSNGLPSMMRQGLGGSLLLPAAGRQTQGEQKAPVTAGAVCASPAQPDRASYVSPVSQQAYAPQDHLQVNRSLCGQAEPATKSFTGVHGTARHDMQPQASVSAMPGRPQGTQDQAALHGRSVGGIVPGAQPAQALGAMPVTRAAPMGRLSAQSQQTAARQLLPQSPAPVAQNQQTGVRHYI
eukprot:TRINITY_DN72878_c0_g1_i1.p1 TRINITY_DN72878_c0_g1~~TRINITY_DN72878_c0_g1_i1.p1  ORF type:complete len:880 (-),score=180.62 TRINITY_DN72878_c0_g1_i1:80-2719(-)